MKDKYTQEKKRNLPILTLTKYLRTDTKNYPILINDRPFLRQKIISYMRDLYNTIDTRKGFIICTDPKPNCTKKIAIIWVRKSIKFDEVEQFTNKTWPIIKPFEDSYQRIIVLQDPEEADESLKTRLVYFNVDRINWNGKEWSNSWNRTNRLREANK